MIRLTLLAIYVLGFSVYAFKDWFKSLCALILLMAVIEHPDMPKSILGIPGLNPWNVLFAAVFVAWISARRREGLKWDLPGHITALLCAYLLVILVGWFRMFMNPGLLLASKGSMISEHLINTIKWVIPGLMLFDACRTGRRMQLALISTLAVYLLLALQVIKWMPLGFAMDGEALARRSVKILVNEVGYHRVNMSAMLAGASWAIFAARPLLARARDRNLLLLASVAVVYGQALTAGRAGYVTWGAVGFLMGAMRWRKYMLAIPVALLVVLVAAPGVRERMMKGLTAGSRDVNSRLVKAQGGQGQQGSVDTYTLTAGRSIVWPLVIDKIREKPLFGWGREGMQRTGLTGYLSTMFAEGFAHPHNAYLEMLLDNGFFGLVLVIPFYLVMLWTSLSLFYDSRSPLFMAVGGATSAITLALLIAGLSSQTFYPREGWLGMWSLFGLTLRVHLERKRWQPSQGASTPAVSAAAAPSFAVPAPVTRTATFRGGLPRSGAPSSVPARRAPGPFAVRRPPARSVPARTVKLPAGRTRPDNAVTATTLLDDLAVPAYTLAPDRSAPPERRPPSVRTARAIPSPQRRSAK
jgi:O-antigen ligase